MTSRNLTTFYGDGGGGFKRDISAVCRVSSLRDLSTGVLERTLCFRDGVPRDFVDEAARRLSG